MNNNYICVYDFETGSKRASVTQPTQLSALMIEPRNLKIVKGSLFNSEIKPEFDDEKAIAMGLEPVQDEALEITKKTREQLANAPHIDQVWLDFRAYTREYRVGKNAWGSPVAAGMNIVNFDSVIINRLANHYGDIDKNWGNQTIFHPLFQYDLMIDFWKMTENFRHNQSNSVSMDNMREFFGMSKDGAHDAKYDVIDTAELIIRYIKLMRANVKGLACKKCNHLNKIRFEKSLAKWERPDI